MAATVTGAFVLLDRASGPLKRIERQALKTQAAVESVGAALDKSGGGSSGSKALETHERSLRNVERQAKLTSQSHSKLSNDMSRAGSSSQDLTGKLGRLSGALGGLGRMLMVLKFAGMIAGVAVLAQGIGTLVGGLFSLLPALAQAANAIAALPGLLASAVQGFLTLKFATGGISDALKAGITMQKQAGQTAIQMGDQHRQAANAIVQAQHGIIMSDRASTDAQKGLTLARREARRELVDMKLAAEGAALGQKRAALSLRQARLSLARGSVSGTTTEMDMADLRLGVQEAQLNLKDSRIKAGRSKADSRRTQQLGVRGNPGMIQARRASADAAYGQTQATLALADAQRQANRLQRQGSANAIAYNQALKQLGPSGQKFVRQLVGMRKGFVAMRGRVGEQLFPQLSRGLTNLKKLAPVVEQTMKRTAKVTGDEAERASKRMTTSGRIGDMALLGEHQATLWQKMLRGIQNLGQGFIDLMVAARPFTTWLANTVLGWTKLWMITQRHNRVTGETANRLIRTRVVLERFGRILKNLWGTFKGLLAAATPLGDRLWKGAEKATKGWDDYVNSVSGSRKIQVWFNKLYEPLHALGQLTKDLLKAWARLTVQPSFTKSVEALRAAVPGIERLLTNAATIGPAAIKVISSFVDLLAALPFSPLETFLKMLSKLMQALRWLIDHVPGLGNLLAGLLLAGMISKSIGLMEVLIGRWRTYLGMGALGGRGRGGTSGPPIVPTGGGPGAPPIIAGAPGARPGAVPPGGYPGGRVPGTNVIIPPGATGGGGGGGGGAAARGGRVAGGAKAAGRFLAPAMIIGGVMGATGKDMNFTERLTAAVQGATFGIFPHIQTGAEAKQAGVDTATQKLTDMGTAGSSAATQRQINRISALRNKALARNRGGGGKGLLGSYGFLGIFDKGHGGDSGPDANEMKKNTKAAETYAKALKTLRAQRNAMRREEISARAGRQAGGLADSFTIRSQGGAHLAKARAGVKTDFAKEFREAGMHGKFELARGVAAWTGQLSHGDKSMRRTANQLNKYIVAQFKGVHRDVTVVNGQIVESAGRDWGRIRKALSDPVERARQDVTKGFTAMQRAALSSLTDMGYSRSEASKILKGADAKAAPSLSTGSSTASSGGDQTSRPGANARGGRIPGTGLKDTVPIGHNQIAAPGELVVNRHTERRVKSRYGVDLGREVAGERRPHSAALDRALKGNYIRAHAKGGRIVPIPGNPGESIDRGVLPALMQILNKYHAKVTDGLGTSPPHAPNSDHLWGGAVDLVPGGGGYGSASGDWGSIDALAAWAEPTQNQPRYPFRWVGYTGDPGHGRGNHLHLSWRRDAVGKLIDGLGSGGAVSGALGAGAAKAIKAARSGIAGPGGAIANAAMAAMAAGLNGRLGVGGGGGGNYSGKGVMTPNQVARLAESVGLPGVTFQQIAKGESGYNPRAVGHDPGGTEGLGLWQITTRYNDDIIKRFGGREAMFNPRTNALAAKAIYDRQGIKAWYGTKYMTGTNLHYQGKEMGGRIPDWGGWNKAGGSFTVHKPTVFGAGEGGSETVQITPKGQAKGGGPASLVVHIGKIDYRAEGDLRKAIKKELEMVAEDIALMGGGG